MTTKKTYIAPGLTVHGDIEKITFGSRVKFEDAFFGDNGDAGKVGKKCKKVKNPDKKACGIDPINLGS